MNDILKQRLVGALILIALGVVFWPIIFVQQEEQVATQQQGIPPPPAVSMEAIDIPDLAGLRGSPELATDLDGGELQGSEAGSLPDEQAGQASESAALVGGDSAHQSADGDGDVPQLTRSEAPQQLAMDTDGVPLAWTLQVATVSSNEKAETLRRRLLEMNQKAYITEVSSGARTLYRVCVGPKLERAELEKLQPGINAEFGVTTMVVRYLP